MVMTVSIDLAQINHPAEPAEPAEPVEPVGPEVCILRGN